MSRSQFNPGVSASPRLRVAPLPSPFFARRGFTLVELLVVIAIIGILIGLLLPAVQMVRESGRRTQCANNVGQIGLAMQQYLEAKKSFPLNWGDIQNAESGSPQSSRGHSWLTYLLPYLDQKPLYDKIQFADGSGTATIGANLQWAKTVVATFRCGSDLHDGLMNNQKFDPAGGMVAVTNYKACQGANFDGKTTAGVNYRYRKADAPAAAGGPYTGRNKTVYDGRNFGDGVICRSWGQAQLDGSNNPKYPTLSFPTQCPKIPTYDMEIRDGMTNTFAIGEAVPGFCAWSAWYWWYGATATCAMPPNWTEGGLDRASTAFYNDNKASWGFSSRHSSTVNFGMCGGSVKQISNDIDLNVYRALATIDGGEVVTVPE